MNEADRSGDRIRTMVGFALRSGKYELGTDRLLQKNSVSELVLVDAALADNALEKIKRRCADRNCMLVRTDFAKMLTLNRGGCKAIGLTDANMCASIRENIKENNNYLILLGGGSLG